MSDPSSPFQTYDQRFEAVLGDAPRLHHVVATDAHEGPVYAAAEDALYFTTVPQHRAGPAPTFPEVTIKRLAPPGWLPPGGRSSGCRSGVACCSTGG